ncbi:ABC transporter permease [Mesorhizobium sp. M7A.F.Ca.US.001.04.1.1]|uniref:ABC transporter permease n=1 Tax=unclassified Mesorhizobium TaxID=325217 RepID=UPI000FCB082B|nr:MULTISPECIES: ABC transporter permease [unclassified Mesorhizobium]RUY27350.1 ABC transporter permease [Mesorhizobium sp. M7A.F.Ca.US.001.04.2.1]RUY33334.1 ABC transporter permease [Mesorhizobium sp. M7A.F.Ca.US.001.04.1.1]
MGSIFSTSPWRLVVNLSAFAIMAFLLVPSLVVAWISFGDSNQIVFPPHGYSLTLFRRFFTEEGWVDATILSFWVAVCSTALATCLGIPAAYALARGKFPGRRLLALFLLSPMMLPSVVIALSLYIYFFKLNVGQGMFKLVLAHTVVTLPFVIITAATGIRGIDPMLERAAIIMGASRLLVLRRITIPLLTPSIVAGGLFAFLISFDEVVITWFIANAGYTTLPVKMFSSIQFEVSPVLAAISTMLVGISVVVCVLVSLTQGRSDRS